MKKWKRLWLVLLSACALLVLGLAYMSWQAFTPASQTQTWSTVEVPEGASLREAASKLESAALLSDGREKAFILAGILSGEGRRIRPGKYRLSTSMSPWEMLGRLTDGRIETIRLTIPEGYNLQQIAFLIDQTEVGTKEEFLDLANHRSGDFETSFPIEGRSLEGYLFPDTYDLDSGQGAAGLIRKMLERFDELVWEGFMEGGSRETGLTLHETITLASLVEGEARRPEERRLIAGVLVNRLNRGMKLQCDATVMYALGDHKPRLSYADLETESPYNTYLHTGLPPGPINNPGIESIGAAAAPEKTEYLYYVAKPDGSHVFSRSYAEHQAAIRRIKRAAE